MVCVGTGLFYVGQALCLVGASVNAPRIYLGPKLLAGALAVALNWAAAWSFGLMGVALASWVVGGVYTLSVARANRKALASLASAAARVQDREGPR